MNKDYYYKHLGERLGYSRVYSKNAINQSLHEYGPEERSNLNNKKMRFNIQDSNLNAESLNFEKLDKQVERDSKKTDQIKKKIDDNIIKRMDQLRIIERLKGENGGKVSSNVDERDVFRKRQEKERQRLEALKKKGMVGELTRLFLQGDGDVVDYGDITEQPQEEDDLEADLLNQIGNTKDTSSNNKNDDEFERIKKEYIDKLNDKRLKEGKDPISTSKKGDPKT